jgi:hypothetical protein
MNVIRTLQAVIFAVVIAVALAAAAGTAWSAEPALDLDRGLPTIEPLGISWEF